MKKYVYKITNQINGKIYIGQSNDYIRRFKEHKYPSFTSLISRAIQKYGFENFTINALYYGTNYNEMEAMYINYFDSRNPVKGYNIQSGGNEPPILTGENSPFVVYSDKEIGEIIDLLKYTKISQQEIAILYNCHESTISRINLGIMRKQQSTKYPIRANKLSKNLIAFIQWLLINTDLNRHEIIKLTGIGLSSLKAIRTGQNHKNPDFTYPLGGKQVKQQLNIVQKNQLYSLLKEKYSLIEIKNIMNISELRIQLFNEGIIYFEEDRLYPINPNIKESVETIPLIGE